MRLVKDWSEQVERRLGDRLLRYWGFACALFLGVNLLAIPILQARLLDNEPELEPHVFQGHYGYPVMARRVRQGGVDKALVWCADLQIGFEEPLYVDTVHYNPKLSRIVAQCIRDGIVDDARPRPVISRRPGT